MADQTQEYSIPTIDLRDFFDFKPDGTITRLPDIYPHTPPTPDPTTDDTPVLSKDISIILSNDTSARVFLPRQAMYENPSSKNKLPIVLYFHGGGFVVASAFSGLFHEFCSNIAFELPAIVVSVEYRLAPEHRLPAAYDDAMDALRWIETANEEWLTEHADYTNCHVMGSSAGGNIAYHAALRWATVAADNHNHRSLKIKGLVLHHPFFGGVQRTASEERLANGPVLSREVSDSMWDLSLPIGADRDHEYCNPTVGGGSNALGKIGLIGCRVLVTGCDMDPFVDRQIELIELLKRKGILVDSHIVEGGYHGIEVFEPDKATGLRLVLKTFISSQVSA